MDFCIPTGAGVFKSVLPLRVLPEVLELERIELARPGGDSLGDSPSALDKPELALEDSGEVGRDGGECMP